MLPSDDLVEYAIANDMDYKSHHSGARWGNPTKPLTRKTFHVIIHGKGEEKLLNAFWLAFGNHPDRTEKHTSKIVTGAEIRGDDLHLAVEYTVRGGHPADFRKWIGRLLFGNPDRGDIVEAILKETVPLGE